MSLSVGTLLGPYEILSALGVGGMGEVYRARDPKLNRDVALKVLPDLFASNADRLGRFQREAQVLASLNHPNIGHIYGFEDSGATHALVLELVEGPTLADRIAQGPIVVADAVAIAKQLVEALEAAHEQGIVHRDLKPSNIKVRSDGLVKVLDFGLAKALDPRASAQTTHSPTLTSPALMTRPGLILGTAAYMSPEQARGQVVDKRTDIWAFGCVLYEMLSGRPPFAGQTVTDTLAAILNLEPDWKALPPALPTAITRLLRRCLAKDARIRLHDIADARLELVDDASTPPVVVQSPAPSGRRGRPSTAIAATALSVAVIAVSAAIWARLQTSANAGPSFARIIRLTSSPAREWAPAISPDGKWVAYLSNARGPTDVWVKFLGGGEAANLTASTRLEVTAGTGIGGLDISPDGTRVAVMARMRGSTTAFETWELPAPLPGAPHKLLDAGLQGMRWSRDSRRITYIFGGGSAGDALWVANADGTNRREIIKLHGGKHIHWPTWSADGYIYFIDTTTQLLNMEPSGISRVKPETGVVEPVVTTSRRAIFPQPMPDGSGLIYAANPASTELGLWWRARDGRIERQLTRGIGEYAEPRISADGRTLVATLYDVHDSIVRVTTIANGGAPVSMTEGYTGDLDPAIFPEDDRLVLSSSRDGNRHLWTSRLDGTDARPLTSGTSFDERPSISPDGKLIAFVSDRDGHRAVWLMNADGGAPRKLTDAAAIGGLSWSRDGRALAFAGPTDNWPGLWLVSVDDGRMRHIPTPGPDAVGEPVWCPTRDVIAYISATTSGAGLSRIAFVTPAGAPADLTLPVPPEINGFANGTLSWSPDGRRLAAVIQGAGPVSIWIVEPESSTPYHRVTEVSGGPRIRGITWTRDGSALVFGKHDVGSGDIVLMDSPQ